MGVAMVVRRYIYKFSHITYNYIPSPLVYVHFCSIIPTFCLLCKVLRSCLFFCDFQISSYYRSFG